ncbi:MAG: hypothetical protein H7308_00225 [Chthonomonadaceae bacterium]|nr:hypothetical protein [Chthonomonadaceae bacterium]MBC7525957.1 hypothetical protein [Chthonomonadaceae bacterium]
MNVRLLPDHLITLFGNYYLGGVRGEDFVAWAVDRLLEGEDTPYLCVLAGESSSILTTDAEALFRTALEEMNLPSLDDLKLHFLVRRISEEFLADQISAIDACNQIDTLSFRFHESIDYNETGWEEWEALAEGLSQLSEPFPYSLPDPSEMTLENFPDYAKATARKFLARLYPRADWAEQFKEIAASGEDKLLDEETQSLTEWEQKNWKW